MVRLALRSALSDRAADGRIMVIDDWGFDAPRTRDAVSALQALDVTGKALVVLEPDDVVAWKSFRNLPHVHLIETGQLNAYDVLCSDVVIFTRASLPDATGEDTAAPSPSTLARRKTAAEKQALREEAEATAKAKEAEEAPAAEEPAPVKAKKKVIKKKVIKKVLKKKATAPAAESEAASGDLPPRMKPASAGADEPAPVEDEKGDDEKGDES